MTPQEISKLRQALPLMPEKQKRKTLELLSQLQTQTHQSEARSSFLAFCKYVYPGYMIGPHHRKLAALIESIVEGREKRVTVSIAPRMGKLVADDTPILTPEGWRTHGQLLPGDFVFSPSGRPVEVMAVSESAAADVRMEFYDGAVVHCHQNHEWTLYNMSRRCWESKEAGDFLTQHKSRWGGLRGTRVKQVTCNNRALHFLPLVEPLQFPEQPLILHPYVLGAWLGDGSAGKPCVSHAASDQAYVDKIAALGYDISTVCEHADTGVLTTYFSGPAPNNAGRLTLELQALEIYKDKKIPEVYLRGSVQQRLELLAGLLDTDGCVDKNSRCSFTSCNRALVDGVIELVHTLGWRASVMEYQPRLSSSGIQGKQMYWSVAFQPTLDIPVVLLRKQIKRFTRRRRIGLKSVTLDPQNKIGRCIQVDSADGLYLVGHNLVPTHNSEMISYLAPAWYLGRFPNRKIIVASHTADLAINFGRRVRNLVGSELYREIFPNVELQQDSKSASRWGTNHSGEFFTIGVGGALAGRGADLFVIDDAHSEQEAKQGRPEVFAAAWEWFQSGPIQRLMPNGAIIIVGTRWSKADLIGKVIDHSVRNEDSDPWTVVEFPAILEKKDPLTQEITLTSLWPEFWPVEELLGKKAGMDPRYWAAQYLQDPTAEEGALIKREWWRCWEAEDPPRCEFTIMSLDAAQETHNRADYNALTTWGVWMNEEDKEFQIILLNCVRQRLEFPELKKMVLEEYKEWQPDSLIVEKKSNGAALYQEMRRMGVPLSEFTPGKGQDKISRVNAVSDLFQSGIVWAPDRRWARELIEECASFPSGEFDDMVDSTTLALARFRQGGYVRLESDEPATKPQFKSIRRQGFYNPLNA